LSRTDQRIREEIQRLADPPDPAGAFHRVERLLARRALARRAQTAGLAVVVVAGSALGVLGLVRLFGGPTIPSAPETSPEELIVFHAVVGGNVDLYAVGPDGSERRRLTNHPASDVNPALSPDGRWIAFVSDRAGHSQIYVMPAGGGPAMALTEGTAEFHDPVWSPDGSRIAFASNRTGNGDVYVMDADGRNVVQVTGLGLRPEPPDIIGAGDTRQFEGSPTWSPDGTRIAFSGEIGENAEIFVMDADGSDVVQVTDDPAGDWDPAWSPDGSWIAFHTSRGDRARDIYVVRPDGSDLTRLTDDPGRDIQPAWSPDGSRIVFASDRDGALRLFVMDADGSDVVPLTGGEAVGPTWGRAPETAQPDETGTPDGTTPPDETPAGACDESTVRGDFDGDGQPDTATVLRARCSALTEPVDWGIELEWSPKRGGGTLAAGAWPIRECVEWCQALAAPDLDGDGLDELAIQTEAFSIHIFHVYTALPFATGPVPLRVAPPGDPEGGFEPGAVPTFSAGGDAFWTYNVRCDRRAEGRVIVVTAAESLPHDSPDAVWHVRETVLRLAGADPSNVPEPISGEFEVVSVRTYTVPTEDPQQRSLFFDDTDLCGAPIEGEGPG
jgi:Tol biopolymer transport system component